MISHSSGDFNDKNIQNHRLYTIKTYLQLISEDEKNIQWKHYVQVMSFHKLLFISILKKSFQLKKTSFQLIKNENIKKILKY